MRAIHHKTPSNTMKKGEIRNWDALIKAAAVVDEAGQRPG